MSAVLDPLRLAPPTVVPERAAATADGMPEEAWILERCACEIALEAGCGARVVEFGGRSGRGAALLQAAIDALPRRPDGSAPIGRRLVFVPGARTGAMAEVQLAATLRRVRELSPDDTLLVVGGASPRCDSLARFTRLASAASWSHRQLWSDGRARFAIHVLARIAAVSEEDAHVIET
jgi:hypothetical protein